MLIKLSENWAVFMTKNTEFTGGIISNKTERSETKHKQRLRHCDARRGRLIHLFQTKGDDAQLPRHAGRVRLHPQL